MQFECPLRPERSDARGESADQLADAAVDHEEVVDHLLVSGAVDAALRARRLPLVDLEVVEQMLPVDVVDDVEVPTADAAGFGFFCCGFRRIRFDFDVGGS